MKSRSQLQIADRREVAIERQRLAHAQGAHDIEACGVHEGVFPLIMPAQPIERSLLGLLANSGDTDPWGAFEHVKEPHGRSVTTATSEEGPGLSADVIGRHELAASVSSQQLGSVAVMAIATVMQSNPERAVNEDHR
jgi:hypothetical protein